MEREARAGEPGAGARAARVLAGQDARQRTRDLLAMSRDESSVGFKGSPMERAKLRELRRNAAVVRGKVGSAEDVGILTQALDDLEPVVREYAVWALALLVGTTGRD